MNKIEETRKKICHIIFFTAILITSIFSVNSISVEAKDSDTGMGFSVSPILPNTQIDRELGYYYLETKPGEEQTLEVLLTSQKDEKQTIQMFVQDAYTSYNGNLDYGINGQDGFEQDETLINSTSEIVKPVSETVELEPGESKTVSFKVTPPKDSYPGAKIGQLIFKVKPEEDETGKKSFITEEHQFAISIVLAENGDSYNDGDIDKLILHDVKPTIKRGKRLVTANVQNPEPKRMMNMGMIASITKKGETKVIKKTEIPEFQFAPNSNVDLEVDWGLSELAAGEYTLNLSFQNEYGENHMTKDFRITSDVAKKLNKESAFKIKTPTWIKGVAVGTGILTISIFVFVIIRNKKWLKLSRKKRNSRKKNKKK